MNTSLYEYWLYNIPGIGNVTVQKLLSYFENACNIYQATEDQLKKASLSLTQKQMASILSSRDEKIINASYEKLIQKGIHFIPPSHMDYPPKLLNITPQAGAIYVLGSLPSDQFLSVAVVGARNCSEYGRYLARKIGMELGRNGIQVISGLAKGIDVIAQKGAIDAGGYSLGVLGSGVDICYPEENRQTYESLICTGGLLSEYPPGTSPRAGFFPLRNRIISAMADVIVLIEAKEKSGSLITADFALEQGRDIFALPGRVTDSLSHGCNRLIRQGAGIILSPEEFIQDLCVNYNLKYTIPGQAGENTSSRQSDVTDPQSITLSEEDKKILSALSTFDAKSLTVISQKTNLSISELSNALLKLCMHGFIVQQGSSYYKKIDLP